MVFSEDVIKQAWQRSGGRCECERTRCGHTVGCNKSLSWNLHGKETSGGWEAHHRTAISSGGSDTLENCEILCQECHKKTETYGG